MAVTKTKTPPPQKKAPNSVKNMTSFMLMGKSDYATSLTSKKNGKPSELSTVAQLTSARRGEKKYNHGWGERTQSQALSSGFQSAQISYLKVLR